jgi:N-formylmaleamate deformylase
VNSWQAEFVAADGPRLHYTRTGGDKPPLVLAHGVTDDGLCWSRVAAELAPDYDVVMVDARGHGRSDAPESGYDPGQQADDLAGVIAALGLQKPAMLGHSMGAATTLVLAGTYPDVPGAILLEDPPAWWTDWYDSEDGASRRAEMRTRFFGLKEKTREALLVDQRNGLTPNWDPGRTPRSGSARTCWQFLGKRTRAVSIGRRFCRASPAPRCSLRPTPTWAGS